ncbi:glycoside hydrolase family 18 protein [Lepidopterella palustris CBS 459.81]|uniref:chitinase n=1 Tax=Lepidopterella palustris CBS 459.81 TaxID=1314670 RepID=A0A8E2E0R1_9PEZI|nr:glycoside hydrolase family 18 protein [Lepidopterella palustris CBS 459.81]
MLSTPGAKFAVAAAVLALVGTVSAGNSTYYTGIDPCPALCQVATNNPNYWTTYHHLNRLKLCEKPMLLDFAVYTPLDDSNKTKTIRACTAAGLAARSSNAGAPTILPTNATQTAELQVAWWISTESAKVPNEPDTIVGAKELQNFLSDYINSDTSVLFAQYGSVSLGVNVGPRIQNHAVAATVIQRFVDYVQYNGMSRSLLMQVCGPSRDSDYTLGIVASAGPSSLEMAQNAVRSWNNGTCATGYDGIMSLGNITLLETTATKLTTRAAYKRSLHPRADCRTIQVVSGDSCASLASKCGISGNDFTKYNPSSTLCSTLQVGQHVCCSSGTLPDFAPKPNPDGSCASYLVHSGDYCAKIGSDHSLTVDKLESFNKNTWGWGGCNNLQAGVNMCLSTGGPPMPAPLSNAVCGPQVPGTSKPASGVNLANLNPCPLNACCDVWGQCGTTAEFCTPSGTGAPGTATPGTNGCISNCGSDIVNNGSPPSSFMSVAYFEGFNDQRPCVNMDVSQIDTSKYTHVHFAFATITHDFQVDISSIRSQFVKFAQLKGTRRILSFGGWTFSTDPSTYMIFRNGVTAANRNTLATNIANFIKAHNLDGVDIDWEYPGAPDIPGIPPGSMSDGSNYAAFLSVLRGLLPDKSVSIAAPASYWYLKPFPIKEISQTVDYIIFMTYDLHGQWDYGNKFSDPGCPGGNCLRSHINMTETYNALSMITKAGASSNKVIVGVTSYGRSFQMTNSGCTGPMCTYTGPLSGATPGICTQTAGYISNAEINDIIARNGNIQQFKDIKSDSNILVYNSVQWVAYMDDNTKNNRISQYQKWNFGGMTDWAVDLQSFSGPDPIPDTGDPNVQGAMNPYLQGCNDNEREIVLQTWQEAGQLAQDHYEWVPKGKWQDAMTMYMGAGSKDDWSFWTGPGPLESMPTCTTLPL